MAVGDITNGTAYVNTGITYNFLDVVALSATQALAVYTTGAGNDGKVMVIDVAGTVVTFGTPVVLTTGDLGGYRVTITRLSATKALCAYTYNSTGTTCGRIIDVSGSTPTVRAEKTIKTTSGFACVAALTATKVLCIYRSSGVKAVVLDVNADTVTIDLLGAEYSVSTHTGVLYNAMTAMTGSRAICVFNESVATVKAAVLDVSGTVITVGTVATVDTTNSTRVNVVRMTDGLAICSYLKDDATTGTPKSCILTVTGSSDITPGTPLTVSASPDSFFNVGMAVHGSSSQFCTFKGTSSYLNARLIYSSGTLLGANKVVNAINSTAQYVTNLDNTSALAVYAENGTKVMGAVVLQSDAFATAGPTVSTNLPAITALLYGGGRIDGTLPMLSVRMVGGPRNNAINVILPMITASLRGGARLTAALPMLTARMTGTVNIFGTINVTLPMLTARLTGTTGRLGILNVTLPAITGAMRGGGNLNADLPMITARMAGSIGIVGRLVVDLPMITAIMTATQQAHGAINVVLPMIVAGPYGRLTAVLPMLQASLTGHTVVAITYEAYAVNLRPSGESPTHEVTRYTWAFDRTIRWRNQHYGVKASGMYLLGGNLDGAAPIAWTLHTGISNLGSRQMKAAREMFVHGRVGAGLTAKASIGEAADQSYAGTVQVGGNAQATRAKLGRGLKAVYWSFGLADSLGGPADIDALQLDAAELSRKVF